MIEPIVGLKGDGFFAERNSGVPCAQLEMSAAELVVRFRGGCAVDLLLKRFESLIDTSGGEKLLG
jgi:hypothetical protein